MWNLQFAHANSHKLMSNTPEADFDLEKLFLPAWAKESPQHNRYAKFEGEPERRDDRGRGGDRRDRPARRPSFGQSRGPGGAPGSSSPRPPGQGGGGARPHRPGGPQQGRDRGPDRRQDSFRQAPLPPPLPDVQVTFTAEDHGVDFLAKQIRVTGRAYPLFDIAQLVLQKPERHSLTFSVKKKADGTGPSLFSCALDDTLWLSEGEAVRYVLDKHFTTFYQAERTQIDPPKGVYTFVAQCGMSGVILGPPNYHDYQNQIRRVHAERFARIPFDAFKARVKIVKDEEVVKKWVEEQSWKTEYNCLNLPEPLKLPNLEEVEKHFRQVHLGNIIKSVETIRISGETGRNIRDRELMRLLRARWEDQKRFPLQIATTLSQQFASRGLQFFKVNKTVTHVAVARPSYLDLEATPVSDGVKRIVDFINFTPKCSHKQLLTALAPAPAAVPAPAPQPAADGSAPAAPVQAEPTPEMAAVMTDLHWLIHQGHVIEFANGILETAKKPLPRPPKPVKAKPEPAHAPAAADAIVGAESLAAEAAVSGAAASAETTAAPVSAESSAPADAPVAEPVSGEAPSAS